MKGAVMKEMNRRLGFTLIELLVVIIVLGLLAALVAPRMFGKVGKAKQNAARSQIEAFSTALEAFRLDNGRLPSTAEGLAALRVRPPNLTNWDGPYLSKEIPKDPWGRAYVYKAPGEHGDYDIISNGADGAPGGEGENIDIVSWKE